MIRYKKTKKLQQGGQAPASAYAAGAGAFQAANQAGASGALKRDPVGPVVLPDNTSGKKSSGSGAGGGIGKGMFSNLMNQKLLSGKNLVNLTAERNRELAEDKKAMLERYNANPEYFKTAGGLNRLNAYKDKQTKYQNELTSLENLYTNVSKGKNLGQKAIDQNNRVYVKVKESGGGLLDGQITSISLKEYAKDLKADEQKYTTSLTVGQLLASIDDIKQYKDNNNFTTLLRQATSYNTSNSEDVTKFILSNVKNTVGKVTPTVSGIMFPDGKTELTTKDMDNYSPGSNAIIDQLVDQQIAGNGDVRKNAAQQILKSDKFEANLKASENPDQFFEDEIKRIVWGTVKSGLKVDGKTPEEEAEDKEILNDVAEAVASNKWLAADTGFFGRDQNDRKEFEGFITEYEADGTKKEGEKKKSNRENVLTTTSAPIGGTANDLHKDFVEMTGGDNPLRKVEDITLKNFNTITTYGNVDQATFPDGTLVSNAPFTTKQGFLPIDDSDVRSVTLPTTTDDKGNEKLATWAMDIMSIVQDRYQELFAEINSKVSSKDLDLFTEEEKKDGIDDTEIARAINDALAKEYTDLMAPVFNGPNMTDDIPTTYGALMSKKFRLKQFYQMDVIGELNDDYEDMSINKFITTKLSPGAEKALSKYEMSTNKFLGMGDPTEDTVMTTIFIPQHYSMEDVNFKKSAQWFGEQKRKGSDFLKWNDLLDDMSSQHGFDESIKQSSYTK